MKTKKNLVKRALSLVLTLLIVLGLVPVSVFSAFAEELPELSATIDTGDSITLKDADADGYYDISSADELYAFAAIVNGGNTSINGELTADIVVNENVFNEDGTPKYNGDFREWTPIGDSSYGYSGIFDGQNHIVSGLYILGISKDYVGLFGYADNATVKNTGVIDSFIMGNNYVGGVCGQAFASKVINCYNSGVVNGMNRIGGVVGDIDDSTITNCYNTGTVSGANHVGGVSGNAYASKVIDCYNTGEVKGSLNVVGGVVGETSGGGTITNCYNTGEVKGNLELVGGVVGRNYDSTITNCYNAGTVSAKVSVGGLVGYNTISGKVANCYNIGTVSGEDYVGGVVGYNYEGTITNCYNTSTVIGSECVGGVVGENDGGTVTNCYNTGTVSSEDYAGGVVGYNVGGGTITNCYNTGTVSGEWFVGGVVGYSNSDGTITNCYNTGTVSGEGYVGGVAGWNYATTITNCYNAGTVSGNGYVGGVVGENEGGTVTNCYYSDTAYAGGIYGKDITGSAEAKTLDQFKSGEVAYLLQGEQTEEIWGQKIGTDEIPVLGGDKVYFGYTDCSDAEKVYSNTELSVEKPAHVFANGFCTVCDAFEPAKYNNNCSTDDESDDFYEISNAGQLYWFADKVNNDNANFGSANAALTADIVVNEGVMDENSTDVRAWTPIGNDSTPYTGTFDGNGKTVSGLYFNKSGVNFVGLFGGVGTNGTVKNIGVINSYFNGYYYVGGVVGYSYDSTIANCYNTGTVIGNEGVGGVAGYDYNSTITNCYNTGTVSGEWLVGGVVGENLAGTTNDCYNTGTVIGNWYVGGVAGYSNESTIANCYNTGTVSGEGYVGGVAGYNFGSKTITNCYNTGTVIGEDYVGGVVGYAEGATIKNCYNTGTVSGEESVGGVAGYNYDTTITNCYYSDATCEGGINGGDAEGSAEAKTTEQFESGEVAYLLGEAFGQKIGEDDTPVLGGDKVYFGYDTCDEDADQVYSNEALSYERLSHVWNDGFCTVCDKACEHKDYANGFCTVCEKACEHEGSTNGFCADCGGFEPANYNEKTGNYEISNAGQLYWFADKVNNDNANFGSANAVLTADIVVNEGVMDENSTDVSAWTPIGSDINQYTGTFDGNGKTVSGLYFNNSEVNCVGLFGYVGENGTVKNIGVINSYFNGYYYVGGVVGRNYVATITNCYNTGTVIGNEGVGGVVGDIFISGTVTNCYNTGTVSGDWYVGGVVGNNYDSTTTDCYNTGTVSGSLYVGGVAGCNYFGTIADCYNTGTVSGNYYGVGGVAGYNYESTITNCYNTGTVSGDESVGGVAGYNEGGTVTNCYYSETAAYGGINGKDITGSAEAKTTEQFESGEVAYLLGEAFGQTLGEDDTPVLGGDTVYCGYDTCDEDADQVYSNEALSYERLPHVWYGGFCTVCDKACVHTGGTATCTKHAVCEICGAEYGDLDVNNHVGESTPEFNWFAPSYGSCYVEINLICDDCGNSVAYDYGYASVAESAEGTDCLHPGYELYEITFEIDGTSYTDSYKHILKSDNHIGEFENGFCSVCGGFEPAYFNEEEWVYEIGNAGQLYWYAQKLNEENAEISVVLTEDIVIPEGAPNWEPITASYVTFDGQFHTISGINSVHENYTYVGMFGNEVWWYEIKNLHLTDSNFEGPDYVGGLVASMNNGGTVQNCCVTNTTVKGGTATGTLVGFLGMSNVLNCYVDTDTLVGDFNGYGSIENSYYLAEVETEDGGKTLEQFKSGEVAYLLQAGIAGEDIYDDEWNYIETIIPEIWGQTIGKEDYPVLGGDKVYLSDGNYYNKANKLAGYTISLGDKIAVNYYMSLTEKTINDANAKMVFTVPDTGSTYTVEIPVSEAVKSGDYYVFTCEVAAKEMTSVIKAKFVTSEGELQLEDYTVQQYAEVILSDATKYAKEQELVKAMLNYGAYAQLYFNYNTESLANSILDEADKVLSDADLSNYEFALTDNDANVSYYGSALSLETETAIKCYFVIDGDAETVAATVNGKKAELKKNGNLYELKISDISAHQLGNMYEIKVGDLTLTYGAFSYGYTAMSSTKDALKNVVKAMYEYNQMAVAYKG